MKFRDYVNESALSRIMQHINGDDTVGVISPFRGENTKEDNMKLYKKMADELRSMGYGYIPLNAGYKEEGDVLVKEKSFFVPKIAKKDLIKLGVKYKQYSVLFKDKDGFYEIGTNKNSGVGKILHRFKTGGKSISVDDLGDRFTEFFSKLAKGSHRNKKFLFVFKEQTGNGFVGSRFIDVELPVTNE